MLFALPARAVASANATASLLEPPWRSRERSPTAVARWLQSLVRLNQSNCPSHMTIRSRADRHKIDLRVFIAGSRCDSKAALENGEIGPAPPEVRIRNRFGRNGEARPADHRQVLSGGALHVHRMAKEQSNDPRMNEAARGFGEQQHALGFENPIELAQRLFLIDEVMEGLVTKDHIDRAVGEPKLRPGRRLEFDLEPRAQSLRARRGYHLRVNIDCYEVFGPEAI